jgi:hypothetical protein
MNIAGIPESWVFWDQKHFQWEDQFTTIDIHYGGNTIEQGRRVGQEIFTKLFILLYL